MSRRVLALILALSMAFGILGANVYAADGSESFAAEVSLTDKIEAEPEPVVSEAEESAAEEETGDKEEEPALEKSAPAESESVAPEESEALAGDPLAVQAVASGTCGENVTWVLDNSGTLTISGTGDMKNYDWGNDYAPWYNYKDQIKTVVIAFGVTSIGDDAFFYCNLTSISIPNSVTNIGDGAFSACSSLSGIQVDSRNQNYSSVGGVLFNKSKTKLICCPSGKSGHYTVPNRVTSIGYAAFCDSKNLTSITIPNSVTSIGDGAFVGSALKSITIPNSVTSIGIGAFYCCESLTSITIPNSVTSIGEDAFSCCRSLTNITIPNSVTSIGVSAFSCCRSLTSISIPKGIKNIEERAFYGCEGLTSIKIPKSVKSIGKHAFGYYYESGEDKPLSNFTISGYLGTAAETYADENGFKLKIQDKATLSSTKWDKAKKLVTVTWNKNAKGKGYLIQFSKKQNFSKVDRKVEVKKNKKTSVTISGIRKGTYYVRIRIVKGKNASKWSAVKKVKVG